MKVPAEFEWDPEKAEANLRKHRVRFEAIEALFADPAHTITNVSRGIDGEVRFKLVGCIENKVFAAIFTTRGSVCRVISLRRANGPEEKSYGNRSV